VCIAILLFIYLRGGEGVDGKIVGRVAKTYISGGSKALWLVRARRSQGAKGYNCLKVWSESTPGRAECQLGERLTVAKCELSTIHLSENLTLKPTHAGCDAFCGVADATNQLVLGECANTTRPITWTKV
jgi:hypothetical protein